MLLFKLIKKIPMHYTALRKDYEQKQTYLESTAQIAARDKGALPLKT